MGSLMSPETSEAQTSIPTLWPWVQGGQVTLGLQVVSIAQPS